MHGSPPSIALRDRTTLRLGGTPRHWFTVHTLQELSSALNHGRNGPALILGGGSNVVCSDGPFPGVVIEVALAGVFISREPPSSLVPRSSSSPNTTLCAETLPPEIGAAAGHVWVHVAAGERWDAVVEAACRWNLGGIECLSGIPGNAGATPIQNVGAYGQEVSDTLWSVTCMRRSSGELISFTAAECELSYRSSRFKTKDLDKYVVVEVVLKLEFGARGTIRYGELTRQFAEQSEPPTLSEVRAAVLKTRAAKSMVLDPTDPNGRNCGSFFLNPIVGRAQLAVVQQRSADSVPHFDVGADWVKIPAAWLIEHAGFARGHRQGNVGLSTKHTLCLVAHENATALELLSFARFIRDSVYSRFGVQLHPEPVLVGLEW